MIDYQGIELKWQKAWDEAKLFEGNINGKESYMVTAAFPYVNGPQHIGHLRTYGTADVLARYKRMKGFNVLFPMSFHATGTPILALAKRLKNKDQDLINELKPFHIPEAELEKMTDPLYIADYFVKEIRSGMKRAGFSIDWRRSFVSIEPFFSKFIEWQFGILNQKKVLVQGKHPVGWCPNENNAVGMHDTKHDVEPEIEKELSVLFKVENEEAFIACTTFRPETLAGVTNLFINDRSLYALCRVDDRYDLYISRASVEVLKYQFKIEVKKEMLATDLLQKRCTNPITNESLPILPGFFVKESVGTGIVMSVPAHAPFDYSAVTRLKNSGYQMQEIVPKKVLETVIDGKKIEDPVPALYYLKAAGTDENGSEESIEKATKLEYKQESHYGKMITKGYEGMSETDARDKITEDLKQKGSAFDTYVLVNLPVYCRCGWGVVVKVVDSQWFLNYGDKEWKAKVKEAFKNVRIAPEKTRKAFEAAIDWIDLRAVARAQGLGTKFPLDKNYIIESLSDSTLYMCFYTISNLIRDLPVENLKPEFFEYVMLGNGDQKKVSTSTGIDVEVIKKCRESFDYWYVNTSRHSGTDLIFNHLTMYLYNHVLVLDSKRWPKQIAVNGSVLSEGEKMSKSIGNIVPLVDGIERYGIDTLRLVVVGGADLFSDSEFSVDAVNGVRQRLEYLYDAVENLPKLESSELTHIDYWLYSRLNAKIESVTNSAEDLELRSYGTSVLYDSFIELRKYASRRGSNGIVVREYLSKLSLLLSPIAPHISEELWHMLGNDTFSSAERWPAADRSMISEKIEKEEEMLDEIIQDAKQVMELMKRKNSNPPKSVRLIVAAKWKAKVNEIIAEKRDAKPAIEMINKSDDFKGADKEKAVKYATGLMKKVGSIGKPYSSQEDEAKLLTNSLQYLEETLKCPVSVEVEEKSMSSRAGVAMPSRPGIELLF